MSPSKGRYTGQRVLREKGAIIKDWGGRLPLALVYPNSYYLGMSNLGMHTIYAQLNAYPNVVCERVFQEKAEREGHIPPLSVETQRPLNDFAVIAFSVTYELDFFNVVSMLRDSGIPLYASERDAGQPLVIAGGACITANPMPLSPFIDCLCIGDSEPILPPLVSMLQENIDQSREELMEQLSRLDGVYVPRAHQTSPIRRQWAARLDEVPTHTEILTEDTELANLYLIEAERGCSWGCRFCMVGTAFSPMRYRPVDNLIEQAKAGLEYRKRIGLVGPAVCDHPGFEELVERLTGLGAQVSVSSLRIKPFSAAALKAMISSGARTIALAPEAGSQRMRDVIRKNISEDDIFPAVESVAREGVKHLKLYFMVGLPSETEDDIEEMIALSIRCKEYMERVKPGNHLSLSVSPFVPKAGTPFQWLPMERVEVLDSRIAALKNKLAPKGIDVKPESPTWSEVQAVLARGDAGLANVLAEVEKLSPASWRRALKKHGIDTDAFHTRWEPDRPLPWSAIDPMVREGRLERELDLAMTKIRKSGQAN